MKLPLDRARLQSFISQPPIVGQGLVYNRTSYCDCRCQRLANRVCLQGCHGAKGLPRLLISPSHMVDSLESRPLWPPPNRWTGDDTFQIISKPSTIGECLMRQQQRRPVTTWGLPIRSSSHVVTTICGVDLESDAVVAGRTCP